MRKAAGSFGESPNSMLRATPLNISATMVPITTPATCQRRDVAQHETGYAPSCRAEGHPYAELIRTARHLKCQQAEQADRGNDEREHTEEAAEHRHDPFARDGAIDQRRVRERAPHVQ